MDAVQNSYSLVYLNISSNDLTGEGFGYVFDSMTVNQSIIELNICSVDGINRNTLTKGYEKNLFYMLT